MNQIRVHEEHVRKRRGDRGPQPIDNPRTALEVWIYPKHDELLLLDEVNTHLQADGLCKGVKTRDGLLSTTELFLALVRFYQKQSHLPIEIIAPSAGERGKTAKIGLNRDELEEWLSVQDALTKKLGKPGKTACKPIVAMLSLAHFYLKHRKNLAPQVV